MAIVTVIKAEAADGQVRLGFTYQDTNMIIQEVFAVNLTSQPAQVTVTHTPTGRSLSRVIPADTVEVRYAVPQGVAQRLTARFVTGPGGNSRLNDIDVLLQWPAPA